MVRTFTGPSESLSRYRSTGIMASVSRKQVISGNSSGRQDLERDEPVPGLDRMEPIAILELELLLEARDLQHLSLFLCFLCSSDNATAEIPSWTLSLRTPIHGLVEVRGSRAPKARYSLVGEALRYVIPGQVQCSMGCGGAGCRYEEPALWGEEEQAISGVYSTW
ncbi:hypothetical protein DNTS_033841 [Danionella cerebrum]|uniref:Uncharacterized protein n=1 Tax=Danionella cerebrum TaxID=2873325 RepID=A0A553N5F0_9TELE|nr:hypothetical protein DNTS_033841 [Danionella translucida]